MMFTGTGGALSQSPDSYCAVAKTNSGEKSETGVRLTGRPPCAQGTART